MSDEPSKTPKMFFGETPYAAAEQELLLTLMTNACEAEDYYTLDELEEYVERDEQR